MNTQLPILGFTAFSGTGKTTLLEKVIPQIVEQGLRIGLIKASHHTIEPDKPGKDSYRLRHAGLSQTVLSTPGRAICVTERPFEDPKFEDQLSLLDHNRLDMILVEGFRDAAIPKIELHRNDFDRPYLFEKDSHIIALCQDVPHPSTSLPQLDINNPEQVAEFVLKFYQQQQSS
ncbi:molybdopterin-guanine dinucleotide biosynthesis protein B [Parendozoicomonas sp. Alg238-R29]|uniref:molybdopterin-guanine dinucleotide biosynthesis protein B n=1 Tax=Parendozoicomonas sp. Alg238-R29 TaxID=2993446 RepID=UPI00248DFF1B|nr:molybdopterin-guanine dinucleotide biosynthesis protein B [Parendozoicomonas sp. Alg238-R29]